MEHRKNQSSHFVGNNNYSKKSSRYVKNVGFHGARGLSKSGSLQDNVVESDR